MSEVIELRPELEALPDRLHKLPVHRGYPVPWFVSWVDGAPEFRIADGRKWAEAVRNRLCWVCGEKLGAHLTFVIGPMCGINRTTAEPPCHYDCAAWSVRNCPFLSKPQMTRRENDLPEGGDVAGYAIKRNPGASLLWTTRGYQLFDDGNGSPLIQVGEPTRLEWWYAGKPATRAEVVASVESGLPILAEMAAKEEGATAELARRKAWLESRYPAA